MTGLSAMGRAYGGVWEDAEDMSMRNLRSQENFHADVNHIGCAQ